MKFNNILKCHHKRIMDKSISVDLDATHGKNREKRAQIRRIGVGNGIYGWHLIGLIYYQNALSHISIMRRTQEMIALEIKSLNNKFVYFVCVWLFITFQCFCMIDFLSCMYRDIYNWLWAHCRFTWTNIALFPQKLFNLKYSKQFRIPITLFRHFSTENFRSLERCSIFI